MLIKGEIKDVSPTFLRSNRCRKTKYPQELMTVPAKNDVSSIMIRSWRKSKLCMCCLLIPTSFKRLKRCFVPPSKPTAHHASLMRRNHHVHTNPGPERPSYLRGKIEADNKKPNGLARFLPILPRLELEPPSTFPTLEQVLESWDSFHRIQPWPDLQPLTLVPTLPRSSKQLAQKKKNHQTSDITDTKTRHYETLSSERPHPGVNCCCCRLLLFAAAVAFVITDTKIRCHQKLSSERPHLHVTAAAG